MVAAEKDILVDIADEDLLELYKLYEKHLDWAPQVCCAIDNGITWRKKTGDDSMVFMSPNDSWKQDGTFILLMRVHEVSYDIYVFTLDKKCENLYRGLVETKRLNYNHQPHVLFFSVHPNHCPTVIKVAEAKRVPKNLVIDTQRFSISMDDALNSKVSCPPDVYIDKLKLSDAELVNQEWPHHTEGSVNVVRRWINVNGGIGLYLKSTNELVAWVLLGPLGQLALLQVVPQHKMKGYASIVTMLLAHDIAKRGHEPFGTVLTNNAASLNLFKKLGFTGRELSHFVLFTSE